MSSDPYGDPGQKNLWYSVKTFTSNKPEKMRHNGLNTVQTGKAAQMWADNDDRLLPADMGVNTVNLSLCLVVSIFTCTHPEHHADFTANTHTPPRATRPGTPVDLMLPLTLDETEQT